MSVVGVETWQGTRQDGGRGEASKGWDGVQQERRTSACLHSIQDPTATLACPPLAVAEHARVLEEQVAAPLALRQERKGGTKALHGGRGGRRLHAVSTEGRKLGQTNASAPGQACRDGAAGKPPAHPVTAHSKAHPRSPATASCTCGLAG